jgi:hypothetical protein
MFASNKIGMWNVEFKRKSGLGSGTRNKNIEKMNQTRRWPARSEDEKQKDSKISMPKIDYFEVR